MIFQRFYSNFLVIILFFCLFSWFCINHSCFSPSYSTGLDLCDSSWYFSKRLLKTAYSDLTIAMRLCIIYESEWGFDSLAEEVDSFGNNFLVYALLSKERFTNFPLYLESVEYVLARIGISPNSSNNKGNTALHLVGQSFFHKPPENCDRKLMRKAQKEIIKKLIEYGANQYLINKEGKSALHYFSRDNKNLIQLISQYNDPSINKYWDISKDNLDIPKISC